MEIDLNKYIKLDEGSDANKTQCFKFSENLITQEDIRKLITFVDDVYGSYPSDDKECDIVMMSFNLLSKFKLSQIIFSLKDRKGYLRSLYDENKKEYYSTMKEDIYLIRNGIFPEEEKIEEPKIEETK
jgi:hypothetical protein